MVLLQKSPPPGIGLWYCLFQVSQTADSLLLERKHVHVVCYWPAAALQIAYTLFQYICDGLLPTSSGGLVDAREIFAQSARLDAGRIEAAGCPPHCSCCAHHGHVSCMCWLLCSPLTYLTFWMGVIARFESKKICACQCHCTLLQTCCAPPITHPRPSPFMLADDELKMPAQVGG